MVNTPPASQVAPPPWAGRRGSDGPLAGESGSGGDPAAVSYPLPTFTRIDTSGTATSGSDLNKSTGRIQSGAVKVAPPQGLAQQHFTARPTQRVGLSAGVDRAASTALVELSPLSTVMQDPPPSRPGYGYDGYGYGGGGPQRSKSPAMPHASVGGHGGGVKVPRSTSSKGAAGPLPTGAAPLAGLRGLPAKQPGAQPVAQWSPSASQRVPVGGAKHPAPRGSGSRGGSGSGPTADAPASPVSLTGGTSLLGRIATVQSASFERSLSNPTHTTPGAEPAAGSGSTSLPRAKSPVASGGGRDGSFYAGSRGSGSGVGFPPTRRVSSPGARSVQSYSLRSNRSAASIIDAGEGDVYISPSWKDPPHGTTAAAGRRASGHGMRVQQQQQQQPQQQEYVDVDDQLGQLQPQPGSSTDRPRVPPLDSNGSGGGGGGGTGTPRSPGITVTSIDGEVVRRDFVWPEEASPMSSRDDLRHTRGGAGVEVSDLARGSNIDHDTKGVAAEGTVTKYATPTAAADPAPAPRRRSVLFDDEVADSHAAADAIAAAAPRRRGASVEGIDPALADVLRRVDSNVQYLTSLQTPGGDATPTKPPKRKGSTKRKLSTTSASPPSRHGSRIGRRLSAASVSPPSRRGSAVGSVTSAKRRASLSPPSGTDAVSLAQKQSTYLATRRRGSVSPSGTDALALARQQSSYLDPTQSSVRRNSVTVTVPRGSTILSPAEMRRAAQLTSPVGFKSNVQGWQGRSCTGCSHDPGLDDAEGAQRRHHSSHLRTPPSASLQAGSRSRLAKLGSSYGQPHSALPHSPERTVDGVKIRTVTPAKRRKGSGIGEGLGGGRTASAEGRVKKTKKKKATGAGGKKAAGTGSPSPRRDLSFNSISEVTGGGDGDDGGSEDDRVADADARGPANRVRHGGSTSDSGQHHHDPSDPVDVLRTVSYAGAAGSRGAAEVARVEVWNTVMRNTIEAETAARGAVEEQESLGRLHVKTRRSKAEGEMEYRALNPHRAPSYSDDSARHASGSPALEGWTETQVQAVVQEIRSLVDAPSSASVRDPRSGTLAGQASGRGADGFASDRDDQADPRLSTATPLSASGRGSAFTDHRPPPAAVPKRGGCGAPQHHSGGDARRGVAASGDYPAPPQALSQSMRSGSAGSASGDGLHGPTSHCGHGSAAAPHQHHSLRSAGGGRRSDSGDEAMRESLRQQQQQHLHSSASSDHPAPGQQLSQQGMRSGSGDAGGPQAQQLSQHRLPASAVSNFGTPTAASVRGPGSVVGDDGGSFEQQRPASSFDGDGGDAGSGSIGMGSGPDNPTPYLPPGRLMVPSDSFAANNDGAVTEDSARGERECLSPPPSPPGQPDQRQPLRPQFGDRRPRRRSGLASGLPPVGPPQAVPPPRQTSGSGSASAYAHEQEPGSPPPSTGSAGSSPLGVSPHAHALHHLHDDGGDGDGVCVSSIATTDKSQAGGGRVASGNNTATHDPFAVGHAVVPGGTGTAFGAHGDMDYRNRRKTGASSVRSFMTDESEDGPSPSPSPREGDRYHGRSDMVLPPPPQHGDTRHPHPVGGGAGAPPADAVEGLPPPQHVYAQGGVEGGPSARHARHAPVPGLPGSGLVKSPLPFESRSHGNPRGGCGDGDVERAAGSGDTPHRDDVADMLMSSVPGMGPLAAGGLGLSQSPRREHGDGVAEAPASADPLQQPPNTPNIYTASSLGAERDVTVSYQALSNGGGQDIPGNGAAAPRGRGAASQWHDRHPTSDVYDDDDAPGRGAVAARPAGQQAPSAGGHSPRYQDLPVFPLDPRRGGGGDRGYDHHRELTAGAPYGGAALPAHVGVPPSPHAHDDPMPDNARMSPTRRRPPPQRAPYHSEVPIRAYSDVPAGGSGGGYGGMSSRPILGQMHLATGNGGSVGGEPSQGSPRSRSPYPIAEYRAERVEEVLSPAGWMTRARSSVPFTPEGAVPFRGDDPSIVSHDTFVPCEGARSGGGEPRVLPPPSTAADAARAMLSAWTEQSTVDFNAGRAAVSVDGDGPTGYNDSQHQPVLTFLPLDDRATGVAAPDAPPSDPSSLGLGETVRTKAPQSWPVSSGGGRAGAHPDSSWHGASEVRQLPAQADGHNHSHSNDHAPYHSGRMQEYQDGQREQHERESAARGREGGDPSGHHAPEAFGYQTHHAPRGAANAAYDYAPQSHPQLPPRSSHEGRRGHAPAAGGEYPAADVYGSHVHAHPQYPPRGPSRHPRHSGCRSGGDASDGYDHQQPPPPPPMGAHGGGAATHSETRRGGPHRQLSPTRPVQGVHPLVGGGGAGGPLPAASRAAAADEYPWAAPTMPRYSQRGAVPPPHHHRHQLPHGAAAASLGAPRFPTSDTAQAQPAADAGHRHSHGAAGGGGGAPPRKAWDKEKIHSLWSSASSSTAGSRAAGQSQTLSHSQTGGSQPATPLPSPRSPQRVDPHALPVTLGAGVRARDKRSLRRRGEDVVQLRPAR